MNDRDGREARIIHLNLPRWEKEKSDVVFIRVPYIRQHLEALDFNEE